MRQNRRNRWFGGVLAAGLAASMVLQGTAVTAYAEEIGREVSGQALSGQEIFQKRDYVTEGVAALPENALSGTILNNTAVNAGQGIASATVVDGSAAASSGGQSTASGNSVKGSQIITAGGGGSTAKGSTAKGSTSQSGNGSQGGETTVVNGISGQSGAESGQGGAASGQGGAASGQGSTASSGGSTNGTITAGSGASGKSVGPSVYGNIVTEGEKGAVVTEPMLGGASLTMLNSRSESQMLSVILQTSQGNLIVVDGGLGEDGDYLRSQIQARGGHVSAWLLSHPHGDHVGALYKILQDEAAGISSGITIDGIYYSFGDPDWYRVHDPAEQTMAVSIIGTFAGLPQTMLHNVSRGQTIQVDDVTIMVMNDRYELSNDPGNNATIVYKVMVNGRSILFLGDMGEDGGNRLLAEAGADALKSDIVQMAHHGQNGVSEAVYQAINPSVCLWPTPDWLWNSSGNRYKIQSTKGWMSRLNVLRHYCMKDGDQIIY